MSADLHTAPAAPDETGPRAWLRRHVLSPLVAVCIGLVAALIVPEVLGEEFLVRQIARAYAPVVGAWHGQQQREEAVSVMLIDDTSLQSAGQSWPASYGYYARLLDALTLSRPRAVFIDVVFAAPREDPSLERLAGALCRARDAGVPVYLAARRDPAGRLLLRPELEALSGRCLTKVAIEYDPDASDQMAWTYRLAADTRVDDGPAAGDRVMTVAGAIYRGLGHPLPAHQHSDLAVNWGLAPAARGIDWLDVPGEAEPAAPGATGAADEQEGEPYCRQPGGVAYELLVPGFFRAWRDPASKKPICVHHNTLYPSDLQSASAEDEAVLARHVTGRVVMLGTALQGSNDRVLSPLHGRIPGVYMHAMALDNLLAYGAGYKRAAHIDHHWEGGRVLKLMVAGLVLIAFAHRYIRAAKKRAEDPANFAGYPRVAAKACQGAVWLLVKLAGLLLYSGFFVLMLFVGQWLDVGLLTVIHVALYSFAADWLEWNEKLLAWVRREPGAPGPGATPAPDPSTSASASV